MKIVMPIEARSQKPGARIRSRAFFWLLASGSWLLIGCTENTKPTTQPASWTDQAESDPANFNPKMTDPNISGGSIGNFDKPAFDKDLNDVLNP
jgi:hypothetical protein